MSQQTAPDSSRRLPDSRPAPWLRGLFLFTAIWGALYFWVADHPPMTDLAQHAGQVALLKALVLGNSPWRDQIVVNLETPYLLGYGLALPLSFLMPVAAALKLLLSVAYLGFVGMCVVLRRHFNADARLDWLFLPSFLGLATQWGFFTFVVSAPIALLFVLVSDRFAMKLDLRRGVAVVAVGLVLLASHGLVFGFAWLAGALLVIARQWRQRALIAGAVPFAVIGFTAIALFLVARHLQVNVSLDASQKSGVEWDFYLARLPKAVLAFSGASENEPLLMVAIGALLCAPLALGLRIDARAPWRWLPLACVVLILLVVPGGAFSVYYLYHRFAIFFLPAYAWAWTAPRDRLPAPMPGRAMLANVLMVAGCWTVLGAHTLQSWRFDREEADFRQVLAAAEPGHRALTLVYDRDSVAARNANVYLHFPVWYQAEKQGLVDFNFAWFAPQIARFAPGHAPPVQESFAMHPESFDWVRNQGRNYRYFFVRQGPSMPADVWKGADCKVSAVTRAGQWVLFESSGC